MSRNQTVVVIVVLAAVSVALNTLAVHRIPHAANVDEVTYSKTLALMDRGEGYYEAAADAIASPGTTRPRAVRMIRPPTIYVVLSAMPIDFRRHANALIIFVSLTSVFFFGFDQYRRGVR